MATGSSSTVQRRPTLPAPIKALTTLGRIDYEDAFVSSRTYSGVDTAREWARRVLAEIPAGSRTQLVAAWLLLGFRLNPLGRHRDQIAGWKVRHEAPGSLVLGARSVIGLSGELVFARHQGQWWFGTIGRLDNRVARAVWARVAPAHRDRVLALLQDAELRVSSAEASSGGNHDERP